MCRCDSGSCGDARLEAYIPARPDADRVRRNLAIINGARSRIEYLVESQSSPEAHDIDSMSDTANRSADEDSQTTTST